MSLNHTNAPPWTEYSPWYRRYLFHGPKSDITHSCSPLNTYNHVLRFQGSYPKIRAMWWTCWPGVSLPPKSWPFTCLLRCLHFTWRHTDLVLTEELQSLTWDLGTCFNGPRPLKWYENSACTWIFLGRGPTAFIRLSIGLLLTNAKIHWLGFYSYCS